MNLVVLLLLFVGGPRGHQTVSAPATRWDSLPGMLPLLHVTFSWLLGYSHTYICVAPTLLVGTPRYPRGTASVPELREYTTPDISPGEAPAGLKARGHCHPLVSA